MNKFNKPEPQPSIPDRLPMSVTDFLLKWEVLLFAITVLVFVANCQLSPYFLDPWNLSDATYNFTEKGLIALAMALLITSGEIDLSVASIIALSSVAMGALAQTGAPTWQLVSLGIATGLVAGWFNGMLVTRFSVPSIVVTIGTMSLFRGIAYVALGDGVYKNYPLGFDYFGQGYVGWVITFEMVLFAIAALFFGILLNQTLFGRRIYAIGNNPIGSHFSGIRVHRIKIVLFMMTGLMSGVASILLTSRLGSTRPSIAVGWELEIITMVVLGGVNILGGAGTISGVVIAAVLMGLVTFGFGLFNVPGIVMSIFIGFMLIAVIGFPILVRKAVARWQPNT